MRLFAEKLIEHKWESAITLDRYSWGYRANMVRYDTMRCECENGVSFCATAILDFHA